MTTPLRLDKAVSERFGLSRRASQDAIRNGRVDLDGERCDEPGRLVAPEAEIRYVPDRPKARRVVGARVRVLHEDAEVLVVDKPSGLLTVPVSNEPETMVGRIERYLALRHGRRPFVGIVQRLDRETSGALVFAKTPGALESLREQFRARAVERRSLAVVEGSVVRETGSIELPIAEGDDRRRSIARGSESDPGLPALTRYRVVERFGPVASLLACWQATGRTHQVRLHMAAIGHPVVGDRLYRPPGLARSKAQFDRQAIHAQALAFRHPRTGLELRVEAPPPPDLAAWLIDLRNRYGVPNAGG